MGGATLQRPTVTGSFSRQLRALSITISADLLWWRQELDNLRVGFPDCRIRERMESMLAQAKQLDTGADIVELQ